MELWTAESNRVLAQVFLAGFCCLHQESTMNDVDEIDVRRKLRVARRSLPDSSEGGRSRYPRQNRVVNSEPGSFDCGRVSSGQTHAVSHERSTLPPCDILSIPPRSARTYLLLLGAQVGRIQSPSPRRHPPATHSSTHRASYRTTGRLPRYGMMGSSGVTKKYDTGRSRGSAAGRLGSGRMCPPCFGKSSTTW